MSGAAAAPTGGTIARAAPGAANAPNANSGGWTPVKSAWSEFEFRTGAELNLLNLSILCFVECFCIVLFNLTSTRCLV